MKTKPTDYSILRSAMGPAANGELPHPMQFQYRFQYPRVDSAAEILASVVAAWPRQWPDTRPTHLYHAIALALDRLQVEKSELAGMIGTNLRSLMNIGDGRIIRPSALIRLAEIMEGRGYGLIGEYCRLQARQRLAEINTRGGRGREAQR